MKTRDYTLRTGRIKPFHLEDEIETIAKVPKSKPSSKIIRTKKGRRAIAGLIDIEKNHNHSWYAELRERAKKDPNALALFYRGTKVSFKEMFEKADQVAKSLAEMGVTKGDEIPACLSNTPETVYLLLAINKLGAKINLFSNTLSEDYLNYILDGCSDKLFLATDDEYAKLEGIISKRNYKNICLTSLADSLPEHPELCDEYEPELDKYYHYDNKVGSFKANDGRIMDFNQFINIGRNSNITVEDTGTLDDDFLVTYTSGSTIYGHPKPLNHTNRSLIVSGRFHDSELSGNPDLKGLRGMAHIHTDSNTNVITCISDNLMQLWSVGLEPEYSKETALDVMFINKPNYLNMTTSHLIEAFKQYLIDKRFHKNGTGRKMPWLFACFAVGEPVSKGEAKFINKGLRVARAGSGVKIKGFSLPFTTLGIGGGDCEHGGIYYTLWKALYDKANYLRLKNHETGMFPESYVQVSAFKKNADGTYSECDYGEYGLIAANSATTMAGYKGMLEKTLETIITDDMGRDWISSNVIGYIDELNGVHVKGRVDSNILLKTIDMKVPKFVIEDLVCEDTKNILSCSVSTCEVDGEMQNVINIEFQPDKKKPDEFVLRGIINRFISKYKYDISDDFYFRIMSYEESFPLSPSGKRGIGALDSFELDNTFKVEPDVNEKGKVLIRKAS